MPIFSFCERSQIETICGAQKTQWRFSGKENLVGQKKKPNVCESHRQDEKIKKFRCWKRVQIRF